MSMTGGGALLFAYSVSIFGGWLVAGAFVYVMRLTIDHPRQFFRWIDLWVGGAERAVATTLVILAPHLLPPFVGGWVTLKLAVNWQRQKSNGAEQIALVAMVGSVISFTVAVVAALIAKPTALQTLAN